MSLSVVSYARLNIRSRTTANNTTFTVAIVRPATIYRCNRNDDDDDNFARKRPAAMAGWRKESDRAESGTRQREIRWVHNDSERIVTLPLVSRKTGAIMRDSRSFVRSTVHLWQPRSAWTRVITSETPRHLFFLAINRSRLSSHARTRNPMGTYIACRRFIRLF